MAGCCGRRVKAAARQFKAASIAAQANNGMKTQPRGGGGAISAPKPYVLVPLKEHNVLWGTKTQ